MYARALQEAETELVALHHDERARLASSAAALGASLVATAVYPALAVPLFVAGLAIGALAVSSIWHHWDLVDRLADDRDAHLIPEVRSYAARETQMDRRRAHAALVRAWASAPDERVADLVAELTDLADALEDEGLEVDPATAVACRRLVTEPLQSPLLDDRASCEDLRSTILRLRAGFGPRRS
jgi:hypothetical protein